MQVLIPLVAATILFGACHSAQAKPDSPAEATMRAWLSAVARGDSVALDSLTHGGSGIALARTLLRDSTLGNRRAADSTIVLQTLFQTGDSAFVEFRLALDLERRYGAALERRTGAWRLIMAAPLNLDSP